MLDNRLASMSSDQRGAEATMTFGIFVAKQFMPDILPTLKYATQADLYISSAQSTSFRVFVTIACAISRARKFNST